MPANHGLRLDEDQNASPPGPESGEGDPEGAIERRQPRPWVPVNEDRELLAEREFDEDLVPPGSEQCGATAEYRHDRANQSAQHDSDSAPSPRPRGG